MLEIENKKEYIEKAVNAYNKEIEDEKKEVKRQRDKLYSRKYREDIKNGDRYKFYKEKKNTKKFKEIVERIRKLDEKIKLLKRGLVKK